MAIMKLVTIPDQRLRVMTKPVEIFNDDTLQKNIDDMIETMYAANGVGLASTQVGLAMQLTVIDCSPERDQPMVLINPEILEARDFVPMEEGCLSVPGYADTVSRASWVKMKAFDRKGKPYELEATDLLAECIQHELDHLKGTLYIDQLSRLRQRRAQDKVIKCLREQEKTRRTL